MSPNEEQLRAALREGEGQRPDADAVIGRVLHLRYERRRRFTAVAAAAAVVLVLGGGTTLLVRLGSGSDSAGSASSEQGGLRPVVRRPNAPAPSSAGSSLPYGSGNAGPGHPAPASCPATLPELALPGGGGLGSFGSNQPLFARPVAAMRICLYSSGHPEFAVTPALTGPRAAAVARELDDSSNSPDGGCDSATAVGEDAAVYAVDSDGRSERVVTVQLGCPYRATNGTAIRFVSKQFADSLRPRGPYSSPDRLTTIPSHPVGTPVK